jgi:glycerophosphoryl diester phosphodiesterase
LLAVRPPRKWRQALDELETDILHVSRKHLTAKRVETIVASGARLGVYTVNEPAEARTFRAWGVHCVITDAPDRVAPWAMAPLPDLAAPASAAE